MNPSRQRILITGLIVLGIFFIGFFGLRFIRAARQFHGHHPRPFPPMGSQPVETDVSLIRDWMTIGFISHTYQTPPDLLYRALNIPPNGNEHKSLKKLNDEYFPDQPGYVLETVKNTIQANQAPTPVPQPTEISPATAVPSVSP